MFEQDNNYDLGFLERQDHSVEEMLLDSDVNSVHGVLESGERRGPQVRFFTIAVFVGLFILVGRLFSLQIGQGDEFSLAAEGNRLRTLQKFAPRGLITDRNGEILARNIPSFELVAIPFDLPKEAEDRTKLFNDAAGILNMTVEEIEKKVASADVRAIEPVTIKQSLNQEEALKLEGIVQTNTGLEVQSIPIREYLNGPAFSHLLGFTGKLNQDEWQEKFDEGYFFNDQIGKTGVELVYEDSLRGQHGGTEVEVDANGKIIKRIREIQPTTGNDLKLTIDAGLQTVIYNSLQQMLAQRPSSSGAAAVATNPRTGEVLALVSLPSFDNNLFARGIKTEEYSAILNDKSKPMLNRPIAGAYPPGSTIKPLVAGAALEEGVITTKTKINDEGLVRVGNFTYYGWNRAGLGLMDVVSAIAWSSDPFFYIVGGGHESYSINGLGVDRLEKYMRNFNLGKLTGINLPGEEPGFVPSRTWKKDRFAGTDEQNWYLGNTYHLAIGQGYLLVTPLQLNSYIAGIANDGSIMKPVITEKEEKGEISNSGVSLDNLKIVQRGMREVILSGTSKTLQDLPISVAGKTGTAQFDNSGDLSRTHAWYTAYAPFEDPEIVITVLVENGGEGSSTSVPVVKEALKWWSENRRSD